MEEKKIIAYKGFDKNLKCRDFQYEVGKEYEMDGDIKCCERGFHACESPLEVFDHYDMLTSRFAKVEQSGEIDKEENTTKVCSSRIKVKAELKLADMINLGVEWIKEVTSPTKVKKDDKLNDNGGDYAKIANSGNSAQIVSSGDYAKIANSGYYAKIANSGNSAQIVSSGDYAKIGNSGYYAKIANSGDCAQTVSSGYYAKIGNSGDYAKIGNSGDYAQIGNSGYYAKIANSGDCAQIVSSGYSAQIASSGDCAKIGNSGDCAQIASSGDYAKIANSGYYAKIANSGNSAQIVSSGDYAKIANSGDCAQIASSGEHSVVFAAGHNSIAKAKIGSWITLTEWGCINGVWIPICVKTEKVDGERIKVDTFYKLVDGEFKEVEE